MPIPNAPVSAATREADAEWAEYHAATTGITNVEALRRLARLSRGAVKVHEVSAAPRSRMRAGNGFIARSEWAAIAEALDEMLGSGA